MTDGSGCVTVVKNHVFFLHFHDCCFERVILPAFGAVGVNCCAQGYVSRSEERSRTNVLADDSPDPASANKPIGHHSYLYQSIGGTPEGFPKILYFNIPVCFSAAINNCIMDTTLTVPA